MISPDEVPSARGARGEATHGPAPIDTPFDRAVAIMHRLRAPGGCPWDRSQDFDSIRSYTLEETYEVLEAIAERDWPLLQEELGDLLLQVLFYAEMAAEQGYFTIDDVLRGLAEKLIRRHPHVFVEPDVHKLSPEAALGRWNAIKATEKGGSEASEPKSLMKGVPRDLPGLAEAVKIGGRAAEVHFDWPDASGVWAKLEEELAELRAELSKGHGRDHAGAQEAELGDVLFTLAQLGRHLGLNPEAGLKHANAKFRARFQAMERAAWAKSEELANLSPQAWDALWNAAKVELTR